VSPDPTAALGPRDRERLGKVLELLAAERASVSSVVDERAWKVHVADSLTGLEVPELVAAGRVADVGAGAGFPGLALAVALPDAQIDLIESIGRKCAFMTNAAAAAAIPNATVLNTRSEDWAAAAGRAAYDVVTARAVGRLSTLAELASPLLKPNGVLIAWKGKRDEEEEAQLTNAAEPLAMTPEQILLVRSSWPAIADEADALTRHFYAHLFDIDESAARLFSGVDMTAQRKKLAQALAVVVHALDDVDCLLPPLAALAKRHTGYGVEDRHFDSVGDALLWAMTDVLGDAFTPDLRDAWAQAYAMVSSVMRRPFARDDVAVAS